MYPGFGNCPPGKMQSCCSHDRGLRKTGPKGQGFTGRTLDLPCTGFPGTPKEELPDSYSFIFTNRRYTFVAGSAFRYSFAW